MARCSFRHLVIAIVLSNCLFANCKFSPENVEFYGYPDRVARYDTEASVNNVELSFTEIGGSLNVFIGKDSDGDLQRTIFKIENLFEKHTDKAPTFGYEVETGFSDFGCDGTLKHAEPEYFCSPEIIEAMKAGVAEKVISVGVYSEDSSVPDFTTNVTVKFNYDVEDNENVISVHVVPDELVGTKNVTLTTLYNKKDYKIKERIVSAQVELEGQIETVNAKLSFKHNLPEDDRRYYHDVFKPFATMNLSDVIEFKPGFDTQLRFKINFVNVQEWYVNVTLRKSDPSTGSSILYKTTLHKVEEIGTMDPPVEVDALESHLTYFLWSLGAKVNPQKYISEASDLNVDKDDDDNCILTASVNILVDLADDLYPTDCVVSQIMFDDPKDMPPARNYTDKEWGCDRKRRLAPHYFEGPRDDNIFCVSQMNDTDLLKLRVLYDYTESYDLMNCEGLVGERLEKCKINIGNYWYNHWSVQKWTKEGTKLRYVDMTTYVARVINVILTSIYSEMEFMGFIPQNGDESGFETINEVLTVPSFKKMLGI